MATYAVGDIQGCYRELMALLETVGFSHKTDQLWCVGDIVARGPDSADAIRFFYENEHSVHTVLGNHDLNLVAVLLGHREAKRNDKLSGILTASEKLDWVDWLRSQPLMQQLNPSTVISHAGIYPWWSVEEAQTYADEVSAVLNNNDFEDFIKSMFSNKPSKWDSSLSGFDRYRFIVNAFTRMRYCHPNAELDLTRKDDPYQHSSQDDLQPWFYFWSSSDYRLLFGHWAALMGNTHRQDILALDTGCVWGQYMTLYDLSNDKFYYQNAFSA